MTTVIQIAEDFSPSPGGRFRDDGQFSGQQFRDDLLIPALRDRNDVIVILDGADGYPSSFLEEAFGGLVRAGFDRADVVNRVKIRNSDPHYDSYRMLAEKYIREAKPAAIRA